MSAERAIVPTHRQNRPCARLFPDTARRRGRRARARRADRVRRSSREYGSPLVVYDEATLRAQARAYRAAAPEAVVVLRDEGVPERRAAAALRRGGDRRRRLDARRARGSRWPPASRGERLVVHGNNKSRRRARARLPPSARSSCIDSLEEVDRARAAGVGRTLIRVTPGIEADTHEKVRTGHHGSKFGLPPDDALEALRRAPDTEGLHVHIGSQLLDARRAR